MRIGGMEATGLAERFGTPAYVYDGAAIRARAGELRAALPRSVDVAYAVKANPASAVVRAVTGSGLGADVASLGELRLVLRAGVPADRVVVTGPGKADALLAGAIEAGVRAVTVESLGELARLEVIARSRGRRVPILLRAASTGAGETRPLIDALPGKFGMDAEDLVLAVRRSSASPAIEWLGIHAFGASNVLDAAVLLEHVRATVELADRLGQLAGRPPRLIDVGGGLGIPYADDELPLDVEALARGLRTLTAGWRDTQLLLEPGRWLVGPAGWYLTRVVDTKRVEGRAIAVVDGGIHHLLRPALVGQPHRIEAALPVSRRPSAPEPAAIVGPLCTGLDVLDARACLPPLEPGDVLGVRDVGAYGWSESMPFFLSHPTPPEVLVEADGARVIRPSIDPERWLAEPGPDTDASPWTP